MSTVRFLVLTCVLLGIMASVSFALLAPIQRQHTQLQTQIADVEKGIVELQGRIVELADTTPSMTYPNEILWQSQNATEAAMALQKQVVDLTSAHNISLLRFGEAPSPEMTEKSTVAFEFEGEAPLDSYYAFLADLEQAEQKAAIASMRLRPIQSYDGNAEHVKVFVQMSIWAFWAPL